MSGKRATAPCGHQGEHVIGTFVVCDVKGCSGEPAPPKPARSTLCPKCASNNIGNLSTWTLMRHCWECGAVFE